MTRSKAIAQLTSGQRVRIYKEKARHNSRSVYYKYRELLGLRKSVDSGQAGQ